MPRGGPSGGDRGKGGSVFIKANSDLNTLINFRRHRKFAAKAGANGGAKEMFGKNAEDVFVEVPLGTMVADSKTGELLERKFPFRDIGCPCASLCGKRRAG